jgi:hypothetical protein
LKVKRNTMRPLIVVRSLRLRIASKNKKSESFQGLSE